MNALKHGRYSARFQNALERRLAEEIVDNWWELDRSGRARMGMLVRERELLAIECQERFNAMLRESYDSGPDEITERGLRFAPDCPSKFRELETLIGELVGVVERKNFRPEWKDAVDRIYGQKPNWRGGSIRNSFIIFGKRKEGEEIDDEKVANLRRALLEEQRDLVAEFLVYQKRYLETTPAQEDARLAPTEQRWTWVLRAERLLELTLDRKIKLLMAMQRDRRKREGREKRRH